MKIIDNFLNKITMYRLTLYGLFILFIIASVLSLYGKLSFTPQALVYSTLILLIASHFANKIFASIFKVQANIESAYITALILALIISPPSTGKFVDILPVLLLAVILSTASKYFLVIGRKHIFNPVAITIVLLPLIVVSPISWWAGSIWMLPFVFIFGLLIVQKIKRFDLVISFLIVAVVVTVINPYTKLSPIILFQQALLYSPLIFFAFIMLTEPLTTPPTRIKRIMYGIITGLAYTPFLSIGPIYTSLGLALCIGNVFSWLVSPKFKYILTLKSKEKIARDTGEFVFIPNRKIRFKPGQYLEWTLGHEKSDSRGNRRFFTIASSPTEKEIKLGIKFDSKYSSSFKKALAEMEDGQTIMAGGLAGDFILPKDKTTKLCFLAGGIGITPFISMLSYLIDKNEKRDIVLVYSCKRLNELAYTNLIHHAHTHLGIKAVSTLTDIDRVPDDWSGYKGFVNVELILQEVPDYMDRLYYISGPLAFIEATKKILKEIGIEKEQIKTDYFPGF